MPTTLILVSALATALWIAFAKQPETLLLAAPAPDRLAITEPQRAE